MSGAIAKIMEFPVLRQLRPDPLAKYTTELLPVDGPAWLNDFRRESLATFLKEGLPTSKLERWKYTNLANKVRDFPVALSGGAIVTTGADQFVSTLMESLDKGWVRDALTAPVPGGERHRDMALWHLSNTYLRDGFVVDIPANTTAAETLEIHLHGHNETFFAPAGLIRLGDNARLTIIERHDGEGRYWNNALTQVKLGKNAVLRHYRLQDNSESAVYTQNTHVEIETGGIYEAFTLTGGAALSRNQLHAEIKGTNAACNLYGLNLLGGQQHGDSTYLIEHQAPGCTSDQSMRSLLNGAAHGVFQGKVHVHRPAQKTDAYQLSNTLLLSDKSEMDTKPELEIYADDVKCSHGATTGQLEEEPLFYLRSRGLSEAEARRLLISAFIGALLDKIGDQDFAQIVRDKGEAWLRNAL